ncbi:transketolase [Halalkalibacterium halodurans]|uniref:Transketolase n=1 Tax=Halalkalibacterium halodurans (strain ATCC BAA-125 / DSM 18197 / FERM 7344 / JCM 9153 / C-125) TaxID=272558 RepID=TKT_HALH5|nr:transketolase [Halalkalibacterium halodurans]Q9KAD7.1 RecName: Full=Transketolase; Short=TK [Halalkalibacterium halodurans C-125]MED4126479.1 transketolase [Halalkalibacterium halodurans]MED4171861.1 transketolase [Halalkalibacterium halodurans]BAB06071.1 transketolase [Halalkalibacterium halodurans C-125]
MSKHVEQLAVNTIRTLSIDSVEKANSGHPGMPMGAAPMAFCLWTKFMNHNPANPDWVNRDRFVLSAGHGSMLLYSLLHLTGYDLSLEELQNFRQWGSKTPGHPEYGHTPGVEATTGPLGQGVAMAVGMAMAERHLAATYNRDGYNIVDHYTYTICGDGDLMEGVSAEAASLAGHLKLGRMILLYDSNDISLDGDLHHSFSESVEDRFKAYGWHVVRVEDGNNLDEIAKAIEEAKADERPSLIEVKTTIGFGSPNKGGKSVSHGAPLGADEVKLTKEAYEWTYENEFHIPEEVAAYYEQVKQQGAEKEESWNELFAQYKKAYPELASQFELAVHGDLPEGWDAVAPSYEVGKSVATRSSSGEALNAFAKTVPQLFGGSADLASSNKTLIKGEANFSRDDYSGRNVWFGVREFAMGAAMNGMALHGGLKVFGATFFVFSDYLRPAIRLAALMQLPVIYVFTHDSIAVGEDGPTHEPVEQLASLRAMPGLSVIRPADGNESVAAWKLALESKDQPTALVLSRQNLPTLEGAVDRAYDGVSKGAYVLAPANGSADLLLLASGSEVSLAVNAKEALEKEGIHAAVVSMPSWDRFEAQSAEYKEEVLPSDVTARLAIEMGSSLGWAKYVGNQGDVVAIDRFGASAPGERIMEEFGFTVQHVVARAKALLENK